MRVLTSTSILFSSLTAPPSAVDRKVETASTSSDMDIDNGDFEEIDEELEEQNTHRPMIRSSAPMSIPD